MAGKGGRGNGSALGWVGGDRRPGLWERGYEIQNIRFDIGSCFVCCSYTF